MTNLQTGLKNEVFALSPELLNMLLKGLVCNQVASQNEVERMFDYLFKYA